MLWYLKHAFINPLIMVWITTISKAELHVFLMEEICSEDWSHGMHVIRNKKPSILTQAYKNTLMFVRHHIIYNHT
jgi:hypothetical protein